MNRPALVLTEAPPLPAVRHLTALNTPAEIHAHMRTLRAASAREDLRHVVAITVFFVGSGAIGLVGFALLRALILIAQG